MSDPSRTDDPKAPWVGRGLPRREDERLLRGLGCFAADVDRPNQLHAAILHSPHAHARIRRIDTSRAEALPGVVCVLTGATAKAHWSPIPAAVDLLDMRLPETWGLAVDTVRYAGEPIAVVGAEDPYVAEDALAAIEVDYERLPPVLTVEQALDPGTAPLYPGWADNRQCVWDFSYGDVDAAFESAHTVVSCDVGAHRYSAVPLEMRALVAEFDKRRKKLRVQISTQIPHQARTIFSWVFGVPETDVHVVAEDVGGGFGNKLQVDIELVPVLLAVVTGRPVKWVERRSEWLASAPASRDFTHRIEGAFSEDGELLAVRDHLIGDLGCDGAVRTGGAGALLVGGTYITGPYKVQRYQIRVDGVVTNKAPYGAYRGYGKDVANLGMETLMEAAAARLGVDSIALRHQNLVDSYPYELATGPIIESGSFGSCLSKVERAMDLPALRARQAKGREGPLYFGFAAISVLEPSAGSIPMSLFNGYESATVRIDPSGNATVLTGMQHIGQGIETSATQVAADLLGVMPENVRVICGDTDVVPYGLGSYSSRGATYGLSAVYEAAKKVREKMLRAAATLLEAEVSAIDLSHGSARVREDAAEGQQGRALTVAELAKAVYFFPGPYTVLPGEDEPTLEAHAVWTNPQVSWEPDAHGRVRMYPAHASGAQGATLTVDVETGLIAIEELWIAHDCGKMVNPKIVEGQVIGGTIQGLGGVLYERLQYDEHGRIATQTLADYQLPNVLSTPPVHVLHGEVPSPVTPLGTKGIGEAGAIGTPTVVMLALQNALAPLGVTVNQSPLTPECVLGMIDAATGGPL